MFEFLHVADIHLDSPLRGLEKYDGAPIDEIREATRRAFKNLVELAIERKVAFVLIAGDLYDGDWRDYSTGLFFVSQVARLRDAGISVYVITGNHDAQNKMTKSLRLPENPNKTQVMLSSRQAQTVLLEDLGVAIHGRGFATAKVTENVVDSYPARCDDFFNIGLLHTSLDTESEEDHARYAPCKLHDLRQKGYQYWALGHIHQRAVRQEDPPVVFPGNIQGRHIREAGSKGATLVTVQENDRCDLQFLPLDVFRWEECRIALDSIQEPDELMSVFSAELSQLVERHQHMPLAVRVVATGSSSAHERLISDVAYWTNQFRAVAIDVGQGGVWVEKVKLHTTAAGGLDESLLADGPIDEMRRYLRELRENDEAVLQLATELEELRRKLPDDLKRGREAIVLDAIEPLREVLDEIEPLLMQRLRGQGGHE